MTILVTGAAGFIGFHLVSKLLRSGYNVIGVDNFSDYYSVDLKKDRIKILKDKNTKNSNLFKFYAVDISNRKELLTVTENSNLSIIINLAAQAGVRYSIDNPLSYVDSNLTGFTNVLELARQSEVDHLIYASTSSVYGNSKLLPLSEEHAVDHPIQFYAATKRANELMAHSYSHLYNIPTTGLRFFTVYGPWGRPDMALFKFTKNILAGIPIEIFNNGEHTRDFTYVDDIVESIERLLCKAPVQLADSKLQYDVPSSSNAPFRILNIGNGSPVALMKYVNVIEKTLGMQAKINFLPLQPGDVQSTFANCQKLERLIGFRPKTNVETGIAKFIKWYLDYHGK